MVLPDVCCDLVWVEGVVWLSGPQSHARESIHVGREVLVLRLEPGAVRSLVRAPLCELTDRVMPMADIDPPLTHELEALFASDRGAELVRRVGAPSDGEGADPRFVAAAEALARGAPVGRVAQGVGLSERQLERLFARDAGLMPKAFARISRLRRAVVAARHGASLASAAAAHGYADQAHFCRDVRELTGRTPGALVPHVGSVQDVLAGHL